jgi:capsid protein
MNMARVGASFSRAPLTDGSKLRNGISRSGEGRFFDSLAMRRNARAAFHESTAARALVKREVDIVVDCGLKFRSTPNTKILGISKQRAQDWADEFNERFDLYMSSKDATTDNTQTGYQLQRQLFLCLYRDGEYFTRFNRLKNRTDALSILSFQNIDTEMIGGDALVSTAGYNDANFDGIERDRYGRERAFIVVQKIKTKREVSPASFPFIPSEIAMQYLGSGYEPVRIAAKKNGVTQMVHGMIAEYPGQTRGISHIGCSLQEFHQFTSFSIAHIEKAIQQSSMFIATESEGDEDAVNPFEQRLLNDSAGIADVTGALTAAPTEAEIEAADADLTYRLMDEAVIDQPGRIGVFGLPPKQKIKPIQNTAPVTEYPAFVDSFFSYLAAASGQSIETVLMKFGQNYSASRATLILVWRIARIFQNELISDALDPMKQAFAEVEIASGRIQAPGWGNPVMRAAWLDGRWIGAPMPEINPYDQAKANALNASMGATDLDRIALENNGSDGKANREKLQQQVPELPEMPFNAKSGGSTGGDSRDNRRDEDA